MTSHGLSARDWTIEPSGRLGPLALGAPRATILNVLGEPTSSNRSEPLEFLEYGDVTVMLNSGTASMIVADEAYRGATPQGLRTMLAMHEAERLVGTLWYDSEESLWRFAGSEHIAVEVVRPPRTGETAIDGDWVAEAYNLSDPAVAVIRRIYLVESVTAESATAKP
jgi:hypothetical protein